MKQSLVSSSALGTQLSCLWKMTLDTAPQSVAARHLVKWVLNTSVQMSIVIVSVGDPDVILVEVDCTVLFDVAGALAGEVAVHPGGGVDGEFGQAVGHGLLGDLLK